MKGLKNYLYFSQPDISGIILQCSRIASSLLEGDTISEDIIVFSSIGIEWFEVIVDGLIIFSIRAISTRIAYTHHIMTTVHIAHDMIQPIVRYGWQPRFMELVFSQEEDIRLNCLMINYDVRVWFQGQWVSLFVLYYQ